MKSKTVRWVVVIGLIVVVALVIVSKSTGGNDLTKVATEKAGLHTITEIVSATGKIYPETEVKISPEVSGEIILLNIQEGDSVHKGDVLVKINPNIYESMVNQAQASVDQTKSSANNYQELVRQSESQFELARKTHERNKTLFEKKLISAQDFEQSEASFKSAKASLDATKANTAGGMFAIKGSVANLSQAQENLLKTTIKAPTSGIISQLNVKRGERVVGTAQFTGTELLTIADMSRMEVRVDVSETDISKVKIGDTTVVTTEAYRERKFIGIVSKIGVSAKAGTTSAGTDQVTNYMVHVLILPDSYKDLVSVDGKGKFPFKPGMSSSVEIQTNKQFNILSVPVNAVTTREWADSIKNAPGFKSSDKTRKVVFVFDSKNQSVSIRDVATGLQDNAYLQITQGLKEGEEVVVAPYGAIARTLSDQAKVKQVAKDQLFDTKSKE